MSDSEPIGRARWTGVADEPLRRTRDAKWKQADHEFVARRGAKSDYHEIFSLKLMERLEVDPDFDTEWYS